MRTGLGIAQPVAGATARRRMRAAERRELILTAATRVFAARGYHAASMDEIAAASGVSKAVVYDHFTAKRQLYVELLDAIQAQIDDVVSAALEPVPVGTAARVRVAVDAFFGYVQEHADACRVLFLEMRGTSEVADVVRQLEERVTVGLSATLGSDPTIFGGHPERDRQLRILAELLTSAVHGLASWWHRHPSVPRGDLVERTVGVIAPAIEAARS